MSQTPRSSPSRLGNNTLPNLFQSAPQPVLLLPPPGVTPVLNLVLLVPVRTFTFLSALCVSPDKTHCVVLPVALCK